MQENVVSLCFNAIVMFFVIIICRLRIFLYLCRYKVDAHTDGYLFDR